MFFCKVWGEGRERNERRLFSGLAGREAAEGGELLELSPLSSLTAPGLRKANLVSVLKKPKTNEKKQKKKKSLSLLVSPFRFLLLPLLCRRLFDGCCRSGRPPPCRGQAPAEARGPLPPGGDFDGGGRKRRRRRKGLPLLPRPPLLPPSVLLPFLPRRRARFLLSLLLLPRCSRRRRLLLSHEGLDPGRQRGSLIR